MSRWRLIIAIVSVLTLAAVVGAALAQAGGNDPGSGGTVVTTDADEGEGTGAEVEDADEPGDVDEDDGAEGNDPD